MLVNHGVQNRSVVAWDGTAAKPVDIRRFNAFSFHFQATADLVADTTFTVQAAPPSGADPCLPGTFVDIAEVLTCVGVMQLQTPATKTTILIPNGTKKGALCSAAIPCTPDAFVQLVAGTGGTANVLATVGLHGPQGPQGPQVTGVWP